VQAPYRFNMRRLPLGRVLDIGCGLGRVLQHLDGNGVGVDHNPDFVRYCRSAGLTAYTTEDFPSSPDAVPASFDSIVLAHVIEHIEPEVADEILTTYLPYVRPGGYVHFITPQERGFKSDSTHIHFTDFEDLAGLAERNGLTVVQKYSFPFPRSAGRAFVYNEFNVLTQKA
jgi:2-polyprenyl-3-methyl-5-hydroxy-6-metoxy-1,4-benzoquinol methylase